MLLYGVEKMQVPDLIVRLGTWYNVVFAKLWSIQLLSTVHRHLAVVRDPLS